MAELKDLWKVACLALLCILSVSMPSYAASTQRKFSLAYFDVDVSYPDSVKPGETITIYVTATAKKDCEIQDLTVELFAYSISGESKLVTTISVSKQTTVTSGNSFQKSTSVTVPADALRSFLIAVASESVRTYSYSYSYPYYYGYPYWSYSYWSYGTDRSRYWWWYPVYYSYRTYVDLVDKEMGPVSYVLASTPEYIQLKTDYEKLTADYSKLSSDYSALNTRYSKLNEEHQALLAANERMTQTLAITRIALYSLVVGIVVAAALMYLQRKGRVVVTFQPGKKEEASPQREA